MNLNAIIFSIIAVAGTAGLLWSGFTGAGNDAREDDDGFIRVGEHEAVRSMQQRGDILPLEEILQRARQHHDGRVLETELERRHDGYVYEVEMLDAQGHVWEMKFDASSGELLREERED